MLPLWIIDLEEGSDNAGSGLLALLSQMAPAQRPYWHYTHLKLDGALSSETLPAVMEQLVLEGQRCYNHFSQEGYVMGNFQIALLGNALEDTSIQLFAPLPGLLRDYYHRIVSDHANRGVEITGFLFISGKINQIPQVSRREKIAVFLESVNLLAGRKGGANSFDRVVVYQESQYVGNRYYAELDDLRRRDLLFEYLCAIYLGGSQSPKLFDRIDAGEGGIFSLGAASAAYDSEHHKALVLKSLLDPLIDRFKAGFEVGDHDDAYSRTAVPRQFRSRNAGDPEPLDPEEIRRHLQEGCDALDVDLRKMEGKADPHPVWDLFRSELFPVYYRKYLKFMPARVQSFLQTLSYTLSVKFSRTIRLNCKRLDQSFRQRIQSLYSAVLPDPGCPYATIAQMESVFKECASYVGEFRTRVEQQDLEIVPVPKYLRADYERSRAAVGDDDSTALDRLMDKFKKILRNEPVILGDFVRCFLLGIVCVFTGIPLLRLLSPKVINLGEVARMEWLWVVVLFFLPVLLEFLFRVRRHFKRVKRMKYRMLATNLLLVNRQLSSFLFKQMDSFYAGLQEECTSQLKHLQSFRDQVKSPDVSAKLLLPATMFNQFLLDGVFQGQPLVREKKAFEGLMLFNDRRVRVSELTGDDLVVLLRQAFNLRDIAAAADLSRFAEEEIPAAAEGLLAALSRFLSPMLSCNTADDIGLMLQRFGEKIDLAPLIRMAGINGMLLSVDDRNKPVVRVCHKPEALGDIMEIADPKVSDFLFWITWQRLSGLLDARSICHCQLESLPEPDFADKLALYYAYYRKQAASYQLAGQAVLLNSRDLAPIDELIEKGREGI